MTKKILFLGIIVTTLSSCGDQSAKSSQKTETQKTVEVKTKKNTDKDLNYDDLGNDLRTSMTPDDIRKYNVFFSNFAETQFENFSSSKPSAEALNEFAVHHNVLNNSSAFKEDTDAYYITQAIVNATILKYFGLKDIKPKVVKDGFVEYRNGKFYWTDIMEGAPFFCGTQVEHVYRTNTDQKLVLLAVYEDNEKYGYEPFEASLFYIMREKWNKNVKDKVKLTGYCAAKMSSEFKLLEWHPAKTESEALSVIKKFK